MKDPCRVSRSFGGWQKAEGFTSYEICENREYSVRVSNRFELISGQQPNVTETTRVDYINPYFCGVVADTITIDNITESDITSLDKLLTPKQSNLVSFDVSANFAKIKFVYAYDNTYGELKSIYDIKNNFNVTSSFDNDIKLITNGSGNNIPYRVYVKNYWISFPPDVSIFKLDFDI